MASADQGTHRTGSRPHDIHEDIEAIRARLNSRMADLDKRLQPANIARGGLEMLRSMAEGRPHPVGDAIRRNPLPLLLMGAGIAWMLIEIGRGDRGGKELTLTATPVDTDLAELLADLTGIARQATKALRQAGASLPEGRVRTVLRLSAEERGLTAKLLQAESERLGFGAIHGHAPTGDWIKLWQRVEELVGSNDEAAILRAVDKAEEETLARFRSALRRALPDDLRIALGGRYHEVERTHARLHAFREATA